MSNELFCNQHGPYSASLGSCPHCAGGGRPSAPLPLSEEETGAGGGGFYGAGGGYSDNDETVLPGQGGRRGYSGGGNDVTALPGRGGYGDGGMDEEKTELPMRRRILDPRDSDDIDETVIEREVDEGLMGWLIVKKSPYLRRGHIIKIRPGDVFGRSAKMAEIPLDDQKVSRRHALIQMKNDQFMLVDMGSENGTWLNGEEIMGATPISENDEIKLGDTSFVLKVLGSTKKKSE